MNENVSQVVLMDFATCCLVGFLCCLAAMIWYLRRQVQDELQTQIRQAIWLETLFYFRDYTRRHNRAWYMLYPLATTMLAVVLGIFLVNIFYQFSRLQPMMQYPLSLAVAIAVIFVLGVVFRMSKKDYRLPEQASGNDGSS